MGSSCIFFLGVTMKKLLLILTILAGSMLPAAGRFNPRAPMQMGDRNAPAVGGYRGAIMQAILHSTDPKLVQAGVAIQALDGGNPAFLRSGYDHILQKMYQETQIDIALNAALAFETVIMYLYDQRVYLTDSYVPGQSIFVSGIRKSWFDPRKYWSMKNWTSDNDQDCQALIDELDLLADTIEHKSLLEYTRLKATVQSYRHWRRNLALFLVAYLAYDMFEHGYDASIMNKFYQGGLSNSHDIMANHVANAHALASDAYWLASGVGKTVWNFSAGPVLNFVLFGAGKK
jgi:hypothetical protein